MSYFVTVAELGSFTKAAAALRVSQPVLSRHIRRLEVELKTYLLHRNGHGVTLTENGARLVAHGKGILHQVDLTRDALSAEETSFAGKVIVGLPPKAGNLITVPLVSQFRELYPKASISIVEGLTPALHQWLVLGQLDLALLYNPTLTPRASYEQIWSETLYLMSSAMNQDLPAQLKMRELARFPLIIPSRLNSLRSLIESECAANDVMLNIILEVDAINSVLDLVERSVGHAVLPLSALNGRIKQSIRATPIISPEINSRLYIATAARRPFTKLARHTMELIKTELAGRFAPAFSRAVNEGQLSGSMLVNGEPATSQFNAS